MRFTLSSSALSSKLSALSKVINSKNALPILGDFVFDIDGQVLTLTASDGENTMRTALSLTDSDGNGRFAIGSHDLPAEHAAEVVGQGVEASIAVRPRLERPAAARQLVETDPLHVDAAAFGYHLQHGGVVVGIGVADIENTVGFLSVHRHFRRHGEAEGVDGVKMNR